MLDALRSLVRYQGVFYVPFQDQEDIVQDAAGRIVGWLSKLDAPALSGLTQDDFASMLRALVRRASIDWLRRRVRQRPERADTPIESVAGGELIPEMNPERSAIEREQRELVERVLVHLGEPCKTLLSLRATDLSYAELSKRLEKTAGALRWKHCECLKQARALIIGYLSDYPRKTQA